MEEKIARIAGKIKKSKHLEVFTGAGISTESGIPDYRSQGGIWDKFRPVYFDEFMSSEDARIRYWERARPIMEDLLLNGRIWPFGGLSQCCKVNTVPGTKLT